MAVRIEHHAEPIPGYRLLERLGGGGFGEVWKAEAPGGLLKAIKFVYGDLQDVGDEGMRAEQELKALSRVKTVRHPYILSLERFDIVDGQLIIVMELADRNLWDRFKECRGTGLAGIPREELLGYIEETAEALDLMNIHYQLQHLDIKPQNLFLVHQHVKVADFGLVKDLEGMQASVTGGVTPVYAAPETFDGWVSRFSDQYSLAIVYQELLTAQRPFAGANVRQLVMQHLQGTPNLSSLPVEEQPIIARALSKNPDDRHTTCKDLVKALRLAGTARPESEGPQPGSAGAAGPFRPRVDNRRPAPDKETASSPGTTRWIRGESEDDRKASSASNGSSTEGREAFRALRSALAAELRPPELKGDGVLFPALVIGVGQLGMAVLQQLRASLQRRFGSLSALPQLRCLLLDTDPEVVRTATRGPSGVALPGNDVLLAPLNRPTHYLKARDGRPPIETWFPDRMIYRIPRTQVTLGVRALGRLAFCDHYRSIVRRLRSDLEGCLEPEALQSAVQQTRLGLRTNRPRVYVVAGLGGGTGSGMFLDLAYTLRRLLKDLGYERPDVTGLLLVPAVPRTLGGAGPGTANGHDATAARPASPATVQALGNTFAALKELIHYSTPGHTFSARYLDSQPPLRDAEPPFSRCLLLPLPEEGDEVSGREVAGLAGEFLRRELSSPLGHTADKARSAFADGTPWAQRGLYYHTFGLYLFSSPERQLLQQAARALCAELVDRWMTKDAAPLKDAVTAWVGEQRHREEWDAARLFAGLDEAAINLIGRPLETVVAEALAPLEPFTVPVDPRSKVPPPYLEPEVVQNAMQQLEAVLGRPPGEEVMGNLAVLPEALQNIVAQLTARWSQTFAGLVVSLIEQPAFRLAGAEEAVRQLVVAIEALLSELEPPCREVSGHAVDAYKRLQAVVVLLHNSKGPKARTPVAPEDIVELLRCYADNRYQSMLRQLVVSAYVSLRGHLSDQLREINFCRTRLAELLESFAPSRPGSSSGNNRSPTAVVDSALARLLHGEKSSSASSKKTPTGMVATSDSDPAVGSAPGRCLYPAGNRTLDQAVETYLQRITPEDILDLDARVQRTLSREFRALVEVCLTSANVLKDVEQALQEEAEAFVVQHASWGETGGYSVAELFLSQYDDPGEACTEIARAFEEASPPVASQTRADLDVSEQREVALLLTPAEQAGQRFEDLAREAVSDVELTTAVSSDDILFYREMPYLPLAGLEQLGPLAEEAYRQMLGVEHFTPHSRIDISF